MSVVQFKEVALFGGTTIGDRAIITLSPFVEGVEGASRTILVTESNEEVKIEDDQTVFTSVKNTITIIAPVLDSQIAILNTWKANDTYVGFAGYTIGGLMTSVGLNYGDTYFYNRLQTGGGFVLSATAQSGPLRDDAYQISEVQQVDGIKHTFRIVLTQVALQGRNATNGILYGQALSSDLFQSCSVSKSYSETKGSTSVLPMNGAFFGATAAVANATLGANLGSLTIANNASGGVAFQPFFPFGGRAVTLSVNASVDVTPATLTLQRVQLEPVLTTFDTVTAALSTSAGTYTLTLPVTPSACFGLDMSITKSNATSAQTVTINSIALTI